MNRKVTDIEAKVRERLEDQGAIERRAKPEPDASLPVGIVMVVCAALVVSIAGIVGDLLMLGIGLGVALFGVFAIALHVWTGALAAERYHEGDEE